MINDGATNSGGMHVEISPHLRDAAKELAKTLERSGGIKSPAQIPGFPQFSIWLDDEKYFDAKWAIKSDNGTIYKIGMPN